MATSVLTREPVRYVTEDEFLSSGEWDGYELIDGVPVESDMSALSSWVGGEVHGQIRDYLKAHRGGVLFPPDAIFKAWPERPNHLRKADCMYFIAGRLAGDRPPDGTISEAPDLAVEVLSPNDGARDLNLKINDYLGAGVRLIWLVHPETQTVQILRANGHDSHIGRDDTLSGEDVLPGFEVRVGDLFPKRAD